MWMCVYLVIFEFPWQFGYGAFALYLVGIAQTLADVSLLLLLLLSQGLTISLYYIYRATKRFPMDGCHHQGLWIL